MREREKVKENDSKVVPGSLFQLYPLRQPLPARNEQPATSNEQRALMALQPSERFVEFSQVGLLARAGEMEEEGVLQLRAVKTDAQGL